MDKRTFIGAVIGIVIIMVGSIIVCMLRFPAGLFAILPGAIPHIVNIARWQKEKRKREHS